MFQEFKENRASALRRDLTTIKVFYKWKAYRQHKWQKANFNERNRLEIKECLTLFHFKHNDDTLKTAKDLLLKYLNATS